MLNNWYRALKTFFSIIVSPYCKKELLRQLIACVITHIYLHSYVYRHRYIRVCMYVAIDKVLQQLLSKRQTRYVFKESQQTD